MLAGVGINLKKGLNMPRRTDNTWLERMAGYLKASSGSGVPSGAPDGNAGVAKVGGEYRAATVTYSDGSRVALQMDANGNLKVSQATLLAGEDLTNNVIKVEQRFTYSLVTADAAVKSAAGFLHTLTFSCNDAAPTAGSIIVYDNSAESGTQIFNHTFTTTPFVPFSVIIDANFTTGLYVGFTTTNDVNVTVSYR